MGSPVELQRCAVTAFIIDEELKATTHKEKLFSISLTLPHTFPLPPWAYIQGNMKKGQCRGEKVNPTAAISPLPGRGMSLICCLCQMSFTNVQQQESSLKQYKAIFVIRYIVAILYYNLVFGSNFWLKTEVHACVGATGG